MQCDNYCLQLKPKARVKHLIQYGRERCKLLLKLSNLITYRQSNVQNALK